MDVLDKLMENYKEIEYIYKRLYNIECNGYKESNLFDKVVNELRFRLSIEERLFLRFVNCDDYEDVKTYIFSYGGNDDFWLRMRDKIILYDIMNNNYYEYIDNLGGNAGKIYDISSKNLFLLYGYFLDNTIDKLVIKGLKNKLLKIKYYNCLVKPNFEKELLNYNFMLPKDIYADLYLVLDIMGMRKDDYEEVILDSYITSINDSIERLMVHTDEEYSASETLLAISINYQCLLKAAFALMSEGEYQKLEGSIVEMLRELVNVENSGMLENIVDIIDNRNEYRSKVRMLSLRPLSD